MFADSGPDAGSRVTVDKRLGGQPGSMGLSFSHVAGRGQLITTVAEGLAAGLTGRIHPGMYIVGVASQWMPDTSVRWRGPESGRQLDRFLFLCLCSALRLFFFGSTFPAR